MVKKEKHGLLHAWERELRLFYERENHTVGNFVFLYTMVFIGIFILLVTAEVFLF